MPRHCQVVLNLRQNSLTKFTSNLHLPGRSTVFNINMESRTGNGIDILSKAGRKEFEQFYIEKYLYVHNLIGQFPRQSVRDDGITNGDDNPQELQKLPARLYPALKKEKQPAKTVDELLARLAQLRGIPKLAYKDKLEKRNLKKKLMKKEKKEKRKKLLGNKVKSENDIKPPKKQKPIYNSEGQMIFSKFDFSVMGAKSDFKKSIKDPELALKKVQEQEKKLKSLKEAGEMDKVKEIVERNAVKTALLRSEGVSVKDDTELLKKSIKKKKSKKEKSAKKWEARELQLQKDKEERQKKRMENIKARVHQKKIKKLKKAAKKGRIIPGF